MVHNIPAMEFALARQNESAVLYQIPQDVMWRWHLLIYLKWILMRWHCYN